MPVSHWLEDMGYPPREDAIIYANGKRNTSLKFQKIKDAIQTHNTARCSIGPPIGVGDLDHGASNPAASPEASPR